MDIPPKRKSNRSQRRASQRGPEAQDAGASQASRPQDTVAGAQPTAARAYVPAPPNGCEPWHFYWCNGHNDWHHHDEDAVNAIAASLVPPA